MRAVLGVLLLCIGLLVLRAHPESGIIKHARAQFACGIGPRGPFSGCGAANNTALDGSQNVGNGGSTTTCPAPALTTSAAGIVIAFVELNGGFAGLTVTDSLGHLSFTQRAISPSGNRILEFSASSSAAQVNDVITANLPGTQFCEMTVFGVKGVNTSSNSGFDSNGALPQQLSASPALISTSNANDFLIVGSRNGANSGVPAGWTQIAAGTFLMSAYQKVTATQSSLSVSDPATSNGIIGDALVSN